MKIIREYKLILAGVLLAGMMSLTSCHSTRKTVTDSGVLHRDGQTALIHPGKGTRQQRRIVEEALTWVGTPYKYAGLSKGDGTDCSGMVMRVYEVAAGCRIPRNSAKQAEYCRRIDAADVRLGDLVFFATGKDPEKVSHVGIVIGENRFVHASSSKGVVVSDMTTPYYRRTFRMFGRVPGADGKHDNDLAVTE